MLGSDPRISASCALSARLLHAEFPPQAYAPPRGDKTQTLDRSPGVTRVPATSLEPSRASVSPNSRGARDGFRSRFRVTEPAPADQQLRSLIGDAMRQLPFEHRAVIYRAYYQGWTTGRIADDLKITEAAVKSQLHDGLRTLRLTFHRIARRR
jgi:DNA-directed RNA polymerase specialized sigma24 family protein